MDFKPVDSSHSSTHVSHDAESEPPPSVSSAFEEKIALAPTRQWTTQAAKPGLLGLLPTAAVLFMTLGFVALILGVLLSFQCEETQGGRGILVALRAGYFETVEGRAKSHFWVLTISSFASHLISDTSSIVMTLVAYRVGAEWLQVSYQSGSNTACAETPSPRQYGLLVRLLGSSSITSIVDAVVYSARSWNRPRLPRMFRKSMWLATAVKSYSYRTYLSLPEPTGEHMWGVAFNESICTDMISKYNRSVEISPSGFECLGPFIYFVVAEAWGNKASFRVMTKSSKARFNIEMVEEATAVVIPAPKHVELNDTSFNITTFAARANCASLNHLCDHDLMGATVNCTSAGYPQLPYFRPDESGEPLTDQVADRVFGIVDGNLLGRETGTLDGDGVSLSSNPAKMAVQLQWDPLEQGIMDGTHAITTSKNLAIDRYPSKPTLYASCDLTFFDAVIRWNGMNKEWALVNTTVSSSERASTLWLPVIWQHATEQLAANLMQTARVSTRDVVMGALGRNLAKLSLATAAGFYSPAEALDIDQTEAILVSAYPVLPVMALLMLLCTYALMALVLFVSSACLPNKSIIVPPGGTDSQDEKIEPSTLTLAQRWLTNPQPLVGLAFPGGDGLDGTRSASYYAINAACDGDEPRTRLAIGLNGERFGVTPWGENKAPP
ncbi:hypothetical protein FRC01_006575 [Tulasnella sp. 417]|nr:hypothetical protein FRC01_006575 [Tulasnella sp. 417]